jgi:hypothetical protein
MRYGKRTGLVFIQTMCMIFLMIACGFILHLVESKQLVGPLYEITVIFGCLFFSIFLLNIEARVIYDEELRRVVRRMRMMPNRN